MVSASRYHSHKINLKHITIRQHVSCTREQTEACLLYIMHRHYWHETERYRDAQRKGWRKRERDRHRQTDRHKYWDTSPQGISISFSCEITMFCSLLPFRSVVFMVSFWPISNRMMPLELSSLTIVDEIGTCWSHPLHLMMERVCNASRWGNNHHFLPS